MPPILAQKDLRRAADLGDLAACFAETGGFKFMPWAFAERRPAAFNPPLGFLPSLRCQAAVFAITSSLIWCALVLCWTGCVWHLCVLVRSFCA
jgi:hypothetical protein